jgi:hypothetical protein
VHLPLHIVEGRCGAAGNQCTETPQKPLENGGPRFRGPKTAKSGAIPMPLGGPQAYTRGSSEVPPFRLFFRRVPVASKSAPGEAPPETNTPNWEMPGGQCQQREMLGRECHRDGARPKLSKHWTFSSDHRTAGRLLSGRAEIDISGTTGFPAASPWRQIPVFLAAHQKRVTARNRTRKRMGPPETKTLPP